MLPTLGDGSAHLAGLLQSGMTFDFARAINAAGKNAARQMCPLKALDPAFQTGDGAAVDALGILGVTPMTGKTMPFISYGGSSMIAMLAVAGLVMRVSLESNPVTVHDVRRAHMSVVGEGRSAAEGYPADAYAAPAGRIEGSTAGPARRRSERSSAFTVVDGSAGASYPAGRAERPAPSTRFGSTARGFGRSQAPAGGYERINLDYDPAERLRTRDRDRNPGPRGGGQRGRSRYDR